MTEPRIKISVVSYLNSKPFILALQNAEIEKDFIVSLDTPADCAAKLLDGRIDIGLVPVAIIPEMKSAYIISDYCIAANGSVNSVLLLSHEPLDRIKSIFLDYQSRTSIQLVKILAEKLWKIQPEWIKGEPGYEDLMQGDKAGIIIGDRALVARSKFPYVYDLSAEWKQLTGLPFVFACWVANRIIPTQLIEKLNNSLKHSIQMIPEVLAQFESADLTTKEAEKYLTENIHYLLDDKKREGLNLFLNYLAE